MSEEVITLKLWESEAYELMALLNCVGHEALEAMTANTNMTVARANELMWELYVQLDRELAKVEAIEEDEDCTDNNECIGCDNCGNHDGCPSCNDCED